MTKNMKLNNNKNRKHIKKKILKKLKHEPGLKKRGDFTVTEGHRYPLVFFIYLKTNKF
jgi:hypothetical protein